MDLRSGLVTAGRLARTTSGLRRTCAVADEVGHAGLTGGNGFCGVALSSCARSHVVTQSGTRDTVTARGRGRDTVIARGRGRDTVIARGRGRDTVIARGRGRDVVINRDD